MSALNRSYPRFPTGDSPQPTLLQGPAPRRSNSSPSCPALSSVTTLDLSVPPPSQLQPQGCTPSLPGASKAWVGSPVFSACVTLQCVYQLHLGTVPHECDTEDDIKVGRWGVDRHLEPVEGAERRLASRVKPELAEEARGTGDL